jgi:hypothetical protein
VFIVIRVGEIRVFIVIRVSKTLVENSSVVGSFSPLGLRVGRLQAPSL